MRKLRARPLLKATGWLLLVWVLVAGVGRITGVYPTRKKGNDAIAAAHAGKALSASQRDGIGAKVKQDANWWHATMAVHEDLDAMHKGY